MDKIVIIGGKSSATLVADNIYDAQVNYNKPYEVLGFAFNEVEIGENINGFPVLCKIEDAYFKYKDNIDVKFVFQAYRLDIMKETINFKDSLGIPNERFFTFIHPSCMLSRSAKIGVGSLIMSHCTINPKAEIGQFCSIMSNVTIGHDAVIGNYNLIATQSTIANIIMGDRNFVGINVSTNNKITIGDDCMIGMGSNVIKSIVSGTKCFGNPAKAVDTPKKAL